MKSSEENKDFLFELSKSLQNTSRSASLHGRVLELKDLKLHIQTRIDELEKQIEETDPLNNRKEQRWRIRK